MQACLKDPSDRNRGGPTCRRGCLPRLPWGWAMVWAVAGVVAGSAALAAENPAEAEWFDFRPSGSGVVAGSPLDLRGLNERVAGEHGRIQARDGKFVHATSGQAVRFWAVNGPPHGLRGEALKVCARMLAARGVNLVRAHGSVFDESTGDLKPERVAELVEIVGAMKAEGIYTHLSIYFPLWFKPKAGLAWLEGYDGTKHPFAALLFHPGFQKQWESWWRAVLEARLPGGGVLAKEPALMGVEIQNEDSFFFWTFSAKNLPEPQLRMLEGQFGSWLTTRYGSLAKAAQAWGGTVDPRDKPSEGRMGFRALWEIAQKKTARDQDTVTFLYETQAGFYRRSVQFLRDLGFEGLVTPSNWTTADAVTFGPLEKLSYTEGDFVDRHGYFGCLNKGPFSEWSLREGNTYVDRSALRFDSEVPGGAPRFEHPVMDVEYGGKPSMISETTWTRPNRYRSEAPLYYAVFGALQGSDAIVHFALDGADWKVKPQYWMQPWTLMAPSQMGQFPAAALIFRQSLVAEGDVLADLNLDPERLLRLEGTPLPQDAAFDELRLKDVPVGTVWKAGQRVDPLIHFAGRTRVGFQKKDGAASTIADLGKWVDRKGKTVTSTSGDVRLNYGAGFMTFATPRAQGASGNLGSAGEVRLGMVSITSPMDNLHVVAVSLDGEPLARSGRILLQTMSEEQNKGWRVTTKDGVHRIESLGSEPWQVKRMRGDVRFMRPDAARMRVTVLDATGARGRELGTAAEVRLQGDALYYLIETGPEIERR